jgi:hypothetical protein
MLEVPRPIAHLVRPLRPEQACVLTAFELHQDKALELQIADHQVCTRYALYLKFKFVGIGPRYTWLQETN